MWKTKPWVIKYNGFSGKILLVLRDQIQTLTGIILGGDLGEKVSLRWLTSPYLELRKKWKCIECIGNSKIWTKTSPWNPEIVAKLLPLWKLQDDPCPQWSTTKPSKVKYKVLSGLTQLSPPGSNTNCSLVKYTALIDQIQKPQRANTLAITSRVHTYIILTPLNPTFI